jgi:N-acetylglucosaminyl-diphospho-decaprenol L-rhamnosyltransferase
VTAGPAGKSGPSTTVVVVNWNGGALLQDCLRSLADDVPGSDAEVVLVDNASTDGSVEEAERTFPGLRVVRRPVNEGFAAGANAGIRAGSGAYVVLLNNDARVRRGFVRSITAPFEAPGGADLAAVTGRVLLAGEYRPAPDGTPGTEGLVGHDGRRWLRSAPGEGGVRLVNSTGGLMTRSGNGRDRDWLTPVDGPPAAPGVFGFNGGCAALRREALDRVGLFDEALFMYYEDTELSWRLRRAGWRVEHASDAVTEHQHAASSGTATTFFRFHNARNRLVVSVAQAPWPVVARAFARTMVRLAAGPGRGTTGRALLAALAMLPAALVRRRATDRLASVPRSELARWLVAD